MTRLTWRIGLAAAAVVLLSSRTTPALAAAHPIDTERSTVTVRVFKTGVFRAFGDNHLIQGAIKSGMVDDGNAAVVRMVIDAASLRVVDPQASAGDREQVQERMLGPDVLDTARFAEVRFESTAAERTSSGWTVHGELTLHGQTRPLTIAVTHDGGHYKGSVSLKQTDFGIAPVSVAGGTVKVKNELTIDFDIVTRSAATE
jgi:polyisoprenoid-binding protein YceI